MKDCANRSGPTSSLCYLASEPSTGKTWQDNGKRKKEERTNFQERKIIPTSLFNLRCISYVRLGRQEALTFEVPINVYPVTWSSLDAELPETCDADTETQGERAFDPFVPWNRTDRDHLLCCLRRRRHFGPFHVSF